MKPLFSLGLLRVIAFTMALLEASNFVSRAAEAEMKTAADAARPTAEEAKEKSRVSHGTNGEGIVTLDAETQKRIGLKVAALAATNLPPVVKGYGRVLDPMPLIQLAADLAPAEVSAEASRKELDRLKILRAQDNASDRALQAAEAQALRDKLLAESLRGRLLFGWGRTIAESDDLPALAYSLAVMQSAVVRVDVPAGETLPGKPTGAQFVSLTTGAEPTAIKFVGPATSTDPQFQGQGFLFLVRSNAPTAGAALTAQIQTDGAPASGILIPAVAIVRHESKGWAYVQTGDDKFIRREAELDRPSGAGYFVTTGFAAGDKVVTVGAQLLLSEELKGQGEE
jgi:membrane fusion protein, multidrug efflux system